jgi:2-polyprenyl-3-methyl-5-hydroxy-6-metoxy-1,4-benzoquinol methylase
MDFYSAISTYYSDIFPLNQEQIRFVQNMFPLSGNCRLIDVGCATGALSLHLAGNGYSMSAFDFDPEMVRLASEKVGSTGLVHFEQLDMRAMGAHFPEGTFDGVLCFGNTLVHLLSDEDLLTFLSAAFNVLKPGGTLAIQILNYDFILESSMTRLPLIENETIRFERYYEFSSGQAGPLVDFITKLTIKKDSLVLDNRVQLRAIRKQELENMLNRAGFSGSEWYGNFQRGELLPNSLPLVAVAVKI